MTELEEKYGQLIEKCVQKDKFIRQLGNVLRGCRCGIVPSALLNELCLVESELDKSDYLQLLRPLILNRCRSPVDEKPFSESHSVGVDDVSSVDTSSPVVWTQMGTVHSEENSASLKLGHGLYIQPAPAYNFTNIDHAYVSTEHLYRTNTVTSDGYMTRTNLTQDGRYANEENISSGQYTQSQVVVSVPETSSFTGQISLGNFSQEYPRQPQIPLAMGGHPPQQMERYPPPVSSMPSQDASPSRPLQHYITRPSDTDVYTPRQNPESGNSFLKNLAEFAYQNFASLLPVSPTESPSEVFAVQGSSGSQQTLENKPLDISESKPKSKTKRFSGPRKSKKITNKSQKSSKRLGRPASNSCTRPCNLRCDVCGKVFAKQSKLNEHSRVHTGEKPFKCSKCDKCFAQSGTLKYHMRIHSGEKPFTCAICGKNFTQPGQLSSHQLTHQEKNYPCPMCKKTFMEQVLLDRHVKIHKKDRPHKCAKCGKGFLHIGNLELHKGKCENSEREHKCQECGQIFLSQEDWEKHDKNKHAKEKPLQCDICFKRFKRPLRLTKHKATHTKVKSEEEKNICDVCGRCFRKPSLLKVHMQIHTGEKPFMCDLCGKMLGSANNFRRHVFGHTGEKNFECQECGKTFATANNLDYHSRIHSGLKPFKCDICGRGFPFSFSLDRHMRTHK